MSCMASAFTWAPSRRWPKPTGSLGDLGCGTGETSATLAPFVQHVIAVDASAPMLQAARKRLQPFDNVDLRRGELEALPIDDARLDVATLMLVLHHVAEPLRALAEVARVLKPGGRLIVVDMLPHDRDSYRQQMGHVWLGFSEDHDRSAADRGRIRQDPYRSAGSRRASEGPRLVCRNGDETREKGE